METGKIEDKPRSGRQRTIRTGANVRNICQMLTRKPTLSHMSVAARRRISRASARRIITKDLKLQSYKKSQTEALTTTTIEKRRVRCRKLLKWLKSANSDNIVFSDENNWSLEEKYNSQNSRVYSTTRKDIPERFKHVESSQFPKTVMVWDGISVWWETRLVFIQEGIKINGEVYRKVILERHVKQISSTFMKGRNWTFQGDGAPAHTAKLTQEWLTNNVPSFLNRNEWPSSSPDLNPCDFYLGVD